MRDRRQRLVYEVVRRHARGDSQRAIARAVGVDRKTIRKILRDLELRRERGDDTLLRELKPRRAPRPSKLDPFVDDVADLLREFPDIRATRLREELEERGFDGGYSIVRAYLNQVRPRPVKDPAKLVVTRPGTQVQVDWAPYKLVDGTPVYALSAILGHSRFRYLHFTLDMRQPTLFRQLRRAIEFHGGVADEYVFDSMPGIVDRWELDEPVLNLRAVDFAAYYGFAYHIAPRGDGAYKGKIERVFRAANESLFNARKFHTIEQLNAKAAWWLEHRANGRPNQTTGRVPAEAWADDLARLDPLPTHPYDDRELAFRLNDDYGYARFDGNFYRAKGVPVGAWVYVRASEDTVALFDVAARRLASYARAPRGALQRVPPPPTDRPRRLPASELLRRFETWGTTAATYARRVADRKRYASVELGRILDLQRLYSAEDLLAAIEHAMRYAAYEARAVQRILQAKAKPRTLHDQLAERARLQIRQAMNQTPVKQRAVEAYGRLLSGEPPSPVAPNGGDDDGSPQ